MGGDPAGQRSDLAAGFRMLGPGSHSYVSRQRMTARRARDAQTSDCIER